MNSQKARVTVGSVSFEEKSIKPPSVATTGKLDTSSSANDVDVGTGGETVTKSFISSLFSEIGDATASVLYDPTDLATIYTNIGKVQEITVTWADGATLGFTGWLDSFDPDDSETVDASGAMTASITICATGADTPDHAAAPEG